MPTMCTPIAQIKSLQKPQLNQLNPNPPSITTDQFQSYLNSMIPFQNYLLSNQNFNQFGCFYSTSQPIVNNVINQYVEQLSKNEQYKDNNLLNNKTM